MADINPNWKNVNFKIGDIICYKEFEKIRSYGKIRKITEEKLWCYWTPNINEVHTVTQHIETYMDKARCFPVQINWEVYL